MLTHTNQSSPTHQDNPDKVLLRTHHFTTVYPYHHVIPRLISKDTEPRSPHRSAATTQVQTKQNPQIFHPHVRCSKTLEARIRMRPSHPYRRWQPATRATT